MLVKVGLRIACLLFFAGNGALAAASLEERNGPSSNALPPIVGPGPFRRLPMIDESKWIIVETKSTPYWTIGQEDAVLSNACQLREFVSYEANRLVVRFNGEQGRGILIVIPPAYRHLLFDQRKRAAPDETYYFQDSGMSSCRVWVGNPQVRRVLDPRGTSLPPRDPRALEKKLGIIRSWPKCPAPDANGKCPAP